MPGTERPAAWASAHGDAFSEPAVAAAYLHRPPYPPAVFDLLARLLPRAGGRVLDIGCGTGAVARALPALGVSVDAVDISAAMVELGRTLPHGRHPALRWHIGPLEGAPLRPPYDLVTAGQSLHWMEWDTVLPLCRRVLTGGGWLALLELDNDGVAWHDEIIEILRTHSTNRNFAPLDLAAELAARGLFVEGGRVVTPPWTFRQSVPGYVESFHGRASLARSRMADPDGFDRAITEMVARHTDGDVELPVVATVVWGRPT